MPVRSSREWLMMLAHAQDADYGTIKKGSENYYLQKLANSTEVKGTNELYRIWVENNSTPISPVRSVETYLYHLISGYGVPQPDKGKSKNFLLELIATEVFGTTDPSTW